MTDKDKLIEIRHELRLTQRQLASALGIKSQSISNVEAGGRSIPASIRQLLQEKLNVNPSYLLTGEGPMFAGQEDGPAAGAVVAGRIPLLRQTVSCGPGQSWEDADVVEEYLEPLSSFPSFKDADVYAFRARGLSMVGVGIQDGDILFFDGRRRDLTDDLYVFALDGNVYCKLLKFDTIQKQIQIYSVQSHNLAEAELIHTIDTNKESSVERLHIFGRVLAWIHENRVMWR